MHKSIVVFDFDGVIVNSHDLVIDHLMNLFSGLTPELFREDRMDNSLKLEKFTKNLLSPEVELEKKARYSKNKLNLNIFEGMRELLIDLSSRTRLALNTAAYDRNCLPMLQKHGLLDAFSCITTRDTKETKEENFIHIAEKLNAKLSDLLFITDTVGDLLDAEKLHIETIGVLWGLHDRSYFERRRHSNLLALVSTVEDLKNLLFKKLNN